MSPEHATPPSPRPIRVTLSEQTAQILRDRIVWGEIPPSSRMVEVDLAKELGVSRTPVREALQRLETDGLLVRQGASLLVAPFDEEVAVETLIMRELLEPFAARESVARMEASDVEALRAVLARMASAIRSRTSTPRDRAALNIEFHNLLNARCPYRRIVDTIQVARDTYSALRLYSSYTSDDLQRVHAEHEEIVDVAAAAVSATGTPDAVEPLIAHHMRSAREALIRNTSASDA